MKIIGILITIKQGIIMKCTTYTMYLQFETEKQFFSAYEIFYNLKCSGFRLKPYKLTLEIGNIYDMHINLMKDIIKKLKQQPKGYTIEKRKIEITKETII